MPLFNPGVGSSVESAEITDGSIQTADIADGAITFAKSDGSLAQAGTQALAHTVTIGDYTIPTAMVSGNPFSTKSYEQTSTSSGVNCCTSGCAAKGIAVEILAGHAAIGTYVKRIGITAAILGSPTGNVRVGITNDSDVIIEEKTIDVTTWTTSNSLEVVTLDNAVLIAANYHIYAEFDSGSASNDWRPRGVAGEVANTDSK